MQQLEIDNYIPPFITETDELRWDDCTVCSTLMGVASATLGEAVSNKNWDTMTKAQLKLLRERIRNHLGSDNQTGGTTMADMRVAFAKEYPWLPEIPSYAEQRLSWGKAQGMLLNGFGAVYMGNPSLVTNPNSKLRRWTISDNFGHAIWVDRARKNGDSVEYYVMDPLGRGPYDGEWVPGNELEEFTWTYNASEGSRYITAFERGSWSMIGTTKIKLMNKIDELEQENALLQKSNQELSDKNSQLITKNNSLESEITTLSASIAKLTKQVGMLKAMISVKNQHIQLLKKKLQRCQDK